PESLQQIEEAEGEHQEGHDEAGGPPSRGDDDALHPRQQDDGTDANAGERQAHGEPTPAYEPVGQKERMRRVAERQAAATHEQAQREVELPGGGHELSQEKPAAYNHGPKEHHSTWPMAVHQAAQERRRDRRHERPDRESTGGQAKRPAKLVEERRKE